MASSHLAPITIPAVLTLLLCVGCGGAKNEETTLPPPATPEKRQDDSEIGVSSEVGGLNEEATSKVFAQAETGFANCFQSRAKTVELLEGTVSFFVIIGRNEKAQSVTVESSTLGDRKTEQCMQKVLFGKKWPKPVGGRTAHAHYTAAPFETLDPDVRPAVAMSKHLADSVRDRLKQQLRKECQVGSPSPYQVTAYVGTDGKVLSASASSKDPSAELTIDCLIDLVTATEFPSPGSYAGKITFDL